MAPGSYYVVFDTPSGDKVTLQYQGGNPATDSNPYSDGHTDCVTLNSGDDNRTIDAGLYIPATLGDFVWNDLNGNGIQDAGEPGIPNVPVNLYTCGGVFVASTITDANGIYSFTGLAPGSYYVVFTTPSGDKITKQYQGGDITKDSNPDTSTGITACVTLASGDNNTTIDAGMYVPASIGDFVWNDLNGNGIQDAGEPGIPNVPVNLYTCGGVFVATTTTDPNGLYSFTGLTPGSYYVVFTTPSGYTITKQYADGNPASGDDSNPNPSTGKTDCVTLASGDNNTTIDAGMYLPASLGDFVWNDLNGNGIQDAGEPGIPKATVSLYTCGGVFIATTTTDANGLYSFKGLARAVIMYSSILPLEDMYPHLSIREAILRRTAILILQLVKQIVLL